MKNIFFNINLLILKKLYKMKILNNDIEYTVLILCSLKNERLIKEKYTKKTIGRWTKKEQELFIIFFNIHGRNWEKISSLIKTRNTTQIRSHAQKYFKKLKKLNRKCITTATT